MERLRIRRTADGKPVYGHMRDDIDVANCVEKICDWLMDPVACPTTWPALHAIRRENPLYGRTALTAA